MVNSGLGNEKSLEIIRCVVKQLEWFRLQGSLLYQAVFVCLLTLCLRAKMVYPKNGSVLPWFMASEFLFAAKWQRRDTHNNKNTIDLSIGKSKENFATKQPWRATDRGDTTVLWNLIVLAAWVWSNPPLIQVPKRAHTGSGFRNYAPYISTSQKFCQLPRRTYTMSYVL